MTTVSICQLQSKHSWFGSTVVHSTCESARRFLRQEKINDLVNYEHSRDEVEALDDDALHALWDGNYPGGAGTGGSIAA
ncbi:hypothetical protein SAMN04487843_101370 [Methylobacterium sp. ap11]|uniref:hypothetical protein n=1 Tax=Methylobacterium sp. ap11 TaxID=1761799 RepID=UPI0008AE60CC|nr:hypothetical protein [Methylobacterium sp. ap11]SEO43289.1 hypothetical protein SAMN04487843_101370 [Methylobacterium sp. ap11]